MSTKAEVLARMADVADDEIVAVPSIWTKLIAEEVYEYAEGEEIELTTEQWARVVTNFESAEFYGDEEMVESIKMVIGEDE